MSLIEFLGHKGIKLNAKVIENRCKQIDKMAYVDKSSTPDIVFVNLRTRITAEEVNALFPEAKRVSALDRTVIIVRF